jgi:surface carbohydrate biosynthesis protein
MILYKITILIDHPSRDLLLSCMIGEQLSIDYDIDFQDGFFTPWGPNFFKRVTKNEKYIVTPSYNITRTPYIRLRKKINNSKLILLHSEQFLAPVSYYEKFNLDNSKMFNEDVSLHLVWNETFKNLLNQNGIPAEKIKVIGNPKFDVLKIIKKHKSPSLKNKILFITNFNAADYSDIEWAKLRKEYFLKDNDDSNNIYKGIRKKFIQNILSIKTYCQENGKEIVIRKHPGEFSQDYELIQCDVIKISKEAELYKDLIDSEIVFVFTSSVVFESFILDIPTYAIEWEKLSSEFMQPPSEDYYWHKPSDVENIIKSPSSYKTAINNQLFEKYFGIVDEMSTSKITEALNEFISKDDIIKKRNIFAFFNKDGIILLLKYVYNYFAISKPKFLFKSFYYKVELSYNKWVANDHFISKSEIEKFKLKAKQILDDENHN